MKHTLAAILLLASVPFTAHANDPMTYDEVVAIAKSDVAFVDNDYVATRLKGNPELHLIDVRTESEYSLGRIPGAQWIPRGKVEFTAAKTLRDADAEIIVSCRTGSRAALVMKSLQAQGYRNVSSHVGFESWAEDGRPIETDLGQLRLVQP